MILHWAGPRDLLAPSVSGELRAFAGFIRARPGSTSIVPGAVAESGAAYQRERSFFAVSGRICARRNSLLREGFSTHAAQPGGGPLGAVSVWRRSTARPSESWATATLAARLRAACTQWGCAFSRSSGIAPASPDPFVDQFYKPDKLSEHAWLNATTWWWRRR